MNLNPQLAFKKQPMVYFAIAFIIGILLSKFLNASSLIPLIGILIFVLYIVMRKWNYSFLLIILLMIVLGFSLSNYKNERFNNSLDEVMSIADKSIEFTGIVIQKTEYSSGQRFILRNIQLLSKDIVHESSAKYIVYPKEKKIEHVTLGDTLRGTGKWQLFNDIRNPGEYDFKKYYHNKEIAGKIYSKSEIRVFPNLKWSLVKSINNLRENVRSKLTAYSDDEISALLSALILGDRTRIDQDLRESFTNVGVIHVLAVSGLHVGYVLIILQLLVRILQIPWKWDKYFVILGLILFTMLSGGRASVIRASIMASLYILAPLMNRKPNAWNIISTAAFLILIVNPNSLYDLGFQLSFTAVMSIIFFYSLFNKILPNRLQVNNIKNNIARFFWTLFLISLSAQMGTIPIVAYYFGRIPLVAIFANLVIIPLIGGFVALGFTKLILFWITPFSFFVDQVIWLIKESIYFSVSKFDKIPFASISSPQFNWIDLIQYILIVVLIVLILKRNYSKIIIFGVIFINSILWPWVFDSKGMDIIFLDLGKNESTIIKNSDDNSILINAGVISMFVNDLERKILPAVNQLNIEKIDWLIKSHGNSNHKVSIAKTVETIPIGTIWDVGFDPNSSFDWYTRNLVKLKKQNYNVINRGDVIRIDDNLYIQFLLPMDETYIEQPQLAMKIVNGSNSILLIDKLTETEFDILINDREVIKSDVLKMTYPKQIPNNLDEFVNIVGASKIVITGAMASNNSPTRKELSELLGTELFFTDSVGAVWLFSDGINPLQVKIWK